MTNIYYDTEFKDDGKTIDLISIGMVCDDGREYYAVSSEFDQVKFNADPWLVKNVAPSLPMYPSSPTFLQLDPIGLQVASRSAIANDVKRFILNTPNPELWAWYGAYDFVVLAQLWGRMIDIPNGLPMYTNDLRSLWELQGRPRFPEQRDGLHNALDDARHNKVKYEWIMKRN